MYKLLYRAVVQSIVRAINEPKIASDTVNLLLVMRFTSSAVIRRYGSAVLDRRRRGHCGCRPRSGAESSVPQSVGEYARPVLQCRCC